MSALSADALAEVRRRAIFECCKWDPQVGDVSAIAASPIVLDERAWRDLSRAAERLDAEMLAAELELIARPNLHRRLGLPRAVRAGLRRVAGPPGNSLRVTRYDFHPTAQGWRISEANADVPGGFIEASGVTRLIAERYPHLRPAGDPVGALIQAATRRVRAGDTLAFIHATAYTDDRQVMEYLKLRFADRGLGAVLAAPEQIHWSATGARLATAWASDPVGMIFRFFPAEWLPALPGRGRWKSYLRHPTVTLCNPATALLVQSKRFPLVWDELQAQLPTWRELLPETRDPREVSILSPEWVLKPALGRVGEGIGLGGVTETKELRAIRRGARWFPAAWVAQRRFVATPMDTDQGPLYPCVGVFVIDGRAAGAYGRVAQQPLIDHRAQDAAVLVSTRAGEAEAL